MCFKSLLELIELLITDPVTADTTDNDIGTIGTRSSGSQADDPPLETLTRDPAHGSLSSLIPQGQDGDLLSSLLGGAAASGLTDTGKCHIFKKGKCPSVCLSVTTSI